MCMLPHVYTFNVRSAVRIRGGVHGVGVYVGGMYTCLHRFYTLSLFYRVFPLFL